MEMPEDRAWAADGAIWNRDRERCSAITEKQTGLLKDGAGAGLATDAADSKRLPLGEPQVFIHDRNRSILVTNL